MNRAVISGRLAADPEYRTTSNGLANVSFRVAVRRRFANQNGVYESDFISCVAWRQTADYVHKYFVKGSYIVVDGSIQTRSYDAQDGTKRYVTEIVAEGVDFGGGKSTNQNEAVPAQTATAKKIGTFEEIPDDDQLPF